MAAAVLVAGSQGAVVAPGLPVTSAGSANDTGVAGAGNILVIIIIVTLPQVAVMDVVRIAAVVCVVVYIAIRCVVMCRTVYDIVVVYIAIRSVVMCRIVVGVYFRGRYSVGPPTAAEDPTVPEAEAGGAGLQLPLH